MARGLVIETDGSLRVFNEHDDLSDAVGGYLEGITGYRWSAYVNEEGKLKGMNLNTLATMALVELGWGLGDYIAGPLVLFGSVDAEGNDTSVDVDIEKNVRALSKIYCNLI